MSDDNEAEVLEVMVIPAVHGQYELLLMVNGVEWKRYGPWKDLDTANLYAAEALRRAEMVAKKCWEKVGYGPRKEKT